MDSIWSDDLVAQTAFLTLAGFREDVRETDMGSVVGVILLIEGDENIQKFAATDWGEARGVALRMMDETDVRAIIFVYEDSILDDDLAISSSSICVMVERNDGERYILRSQYLGDPPDRKFGGIEKQGTTGGGLFGLRDKAEADEIEAFKQLMETCKW